MLLLSEFSVEEKRFCFDLSSAASLPDEKVLTAETSLDTWFAGVRPALKIYSLPILMISIIFPESLSFISHIIMRASGSVLVFDVSILVLIFSMICLDISLIEELISERWFSVPATQSIRKPATAVGVFTPGLE